MPTTPHKELPEAMALVQQTPGNIWDMSSHLRHSVKRQQKCGLSKSGAGQCPAPMAHRLRKDHQLPYSYEKAININSFCSVLAQDILNGGYLTASHHLARWPKRKALAKITAQPRVQAHGTAAWTDHSTRFHI